MKRLYFFILLTVAASLTATTQARSQAYNPYDYITYTRHEVFVQYGAPTFMELSTWIRQESFAAKDGNLYLPMGFVYTGVAALGYKYYTTPYMSIGGYLGISAAMMEMAKQNTSNPVFKSSVLSVTGLVTINWLYYRSGLWEISAHAGAGLTRWMDEQEMITQNLPDISQDTARWKFAYHLSPFHVRWGGTLGVFADLGWGYKGIANAGLSVKF
ncbi:MAG: hypothetical protein WC395_02055 [Bacteroidales bacterium]|jgi:hypothetical protein